MSGSSPSAELESLHPRPHAEGVSVSAVIYSRNEAELLRMSLPAITGFDEVVVCDMQSSDATVAIAVESGARVERVPDARVIEDVRQRGLDAAASDWVLFVDADEILPAGFAEHVRDMVASAAADNVVAFRLRYRNVAFGRTLHHTLVGSAKYSLMHRTRAHFPSPGRAHVPPDFDGRAKDAPSSVPPVLHLNFRSPEQMTEKTLRYADESRGDVELLRPMRLVRELVKATVFGGTWRDGYAGTVVATSAVFGRWYEAMLTAERAGLFTAELPAKDVRMLSVVSGVHAGSIRLRDRLRRAFRRREPARYDRGQVSR